MFQRRHQSVPQSCLPPSLYSRNSPLQAYRYQRTHSHYQGNWLRKRMAHNWSAVCDVRLELEVGILRNHLVILKVIDWCFPLLPMRNRGRKCCANRFQMKFTPLFSGDAFSCHALPQVTQSHPPNISLNHLILPCLVCFSAEEIRMFQLVSQGALILEPLIFNSISLRKQFETSNSWSCLDI